MTQPRAILIFGSKLSGTAKMIAQRGRKKKPKNKKGKFRQRRRKPLPIVSPEEKAAETCGREPGRVTAEQIRALEKSGYDGGVVMRWTKYHADKELQKHTARRRKSRMGDSSRPTLSRNGGRENRPCVLELQQGSLGASPSSHGATGKDATFQGRTPQEVFTPGAVTTSPSAERLSIEDFSRNQLKEAFLAVVGTEWEERDDVIRLAARRMGFERCGNRVRQAFGAAVTGLIRQGQLEYDGSLIHDRSNKEKP